MKLNKMTSEFKERFSRQEAPEKILKDLLNSLLKETNLKIRTSKCKDWTSATWIFVEQHEKWKKFCHALRKYPINETAFIEIIKEKDPSLYFKLVAKGFPRVPEDENDTRN